MRPTNAILRLPLVFATCLAGITVVANLAIYAVTGHEAGAMVVFLCNFPMVFWFAVNSQKQTVAYVDELEARIRQLEGRTSLG